MLYTGWMTTHPLALDHPLCSPRPGPARHGPTALPRARPTTRPRQKINVPCNPCIMHSYFVQRTNERTARKFTSHLAHDRASFLLFRAFSLSLSLPLPFSFCLTPLFQSLCPSFYPPLAREFASGNAPALTNSRPRSLVLSSGRAFPSPTPPPFLPHPPLPLHLFLVPGPLVPYSRRHRNSGWKSLNCTHSHARASFALMAALLVSPLRPDPPAHSLLRPSMTLVELSTRVIPRILACTRVRGADFGEYALFPVKN